MPSRKKYNILAIGDSVMWGQGLAHDNKFVHMLARQIQEQTGNLMVSADIVAHSGARLGDNKIDTDGWKKHPWLYGELPRTRPNVITQAHMARLDNRVIEWFNHHNFDYKMSINHKDELKEKFVQYRTADPDLILVNGAINDFNGMQTVLPISMQQLDNVAKEKNVLEAVRKLLDGLQFTEAEYQERVKKCCYNKMLTTLELLGKLYPTSNIIVPGYYPLFTGGSRNVGKEAIAALAMSAYAAATPNIADNLIVFSYLLLVDKDVFIERSRWWVDFSNKYLKEAVEAANETLGTKRFHFVPAGFGNKGAFAPDGFVFDFKLADIKSFKDMQVIAVNDHAEPMRKDAWDLYYKNVKDEDGVKMKDYRASIGHPNKMGSAQYASQLFSYIKNHATAFSLQFKP